jgi:hypothetical protein
MVRNKASLEQVLDTVAEWQPKGLLPCHGIYQASGEGESFMKDHERLIAIHIAYSFSIDF